MSAEISDGNTTAFASIWPQGFRDLRFIMERHRKRIGGSAVAGAALAVIVSLFLPNQYYARATLLPTSNEQQEGGLSSLAQGLGAGSGLAGLLSSQKDVNTSMAIVRSVSFTERFVKANNLLPKLFPDRWDSKKSQWIRKGPGVFGWIKQTIGIAPPPRPGADGSPSPKEIQAEFSKHLTINYDPNTGLVALGITWTDPIEAAAWANGLVYFANNEVRERDKEKSRVKLEHLRRELAKSQVEGIRQIFYRLIENELQSSMVANTQSEYLFEIIDPAYPPDSKSSPSRTNMVFMGFFAGFLIAAIIAHFQEYRERRSRSGQ